VKLVEEQQRGKGGRNQQLALSALQELGHCDGICLLSGGTDGEDGPTDAAGAVVDPEVAHAAANARLNASDFLARNDAYTFFQKCGGLFITGPTQTNVCDLRVITVQR
jgi:hydroxypyruvate reductase